MNAQFADILPDANTMQKGEILRVNLRETVREILIHISEEINKARPLGETHVYIRLPTHFSVHGVKNEDAQLYVWSTIIQELEAKNYKNKLDMQDKKVELCISWRSELDTIERKKQQDIIKRSCTSQG
jgi:hypothetical protein